MPDIIAVWIVVLHFTVMGYSGRGLPPDASHRKAFVDQSECRKLIPSVRRSIEALPVAPDKIVCEKLEVVK